jgi:hypothetical protein
LVSSYFIYQTVASIDKAAIERLDMILQLATQVKRTPVQSPAATRNASSGGSGGGRGGGDDDRGPHFLWLIRDAQLQMQQSPKEEMLGKLDEGAKKAMQSCFQSYDCAPLPHPVEREEDLRRMESMALNELSNGFQEEYTVFERRVFDTILKPVVMGGKPSTVIHA